MKLIILFLLIMIVGVSIVVAIAAMNSEYVDFFANEAIGDCHTNKCWSRGYFFPAYNRHYHLKSGTESRNLTKHVYRNFTGNGYAWVRLGSPGSSKWDLDTFVNDIMPTFTDHFILITTDGDASVPSDLNQTTVQKLLSNQYLVLWMTQNYDGTCTDPKLVPFPIGFDLHTYFGGCNELVQLYPVPFSKPHTIPKLWSDVQFRTYPKRHGDPRARWIDFYSKNTSALSPHVNYISSKLCRKELWENYCSYQMVLSLPGNGLDCHRTWEALYLGATVVTLHTNPLFDQLLSNFRVLFLHDFDELLNWDNIIARCDALQTKIIPDMEAYLFIKFYSPALSPTIFNEPKLSRLLQRQ